jgi:predicted PurR-regulated permease PerM
MAERAVQRRGNRNSETSTSARTGVGETYARDRSAGETVVLVSAVLALAGLAYTVSIILSPFVLAGGLVYLLYPFRDNPVARRLMWLGVILFSLWFLYSILGLLTPFLLAFLLAYILNPIVTTLEQRHVPRWASSLVVMLLMIGVVVAVLLFILPLAIQQFQGILDGVNAIVNDVAELLKSGTIFEVLARYGIPVDKAREAITNQLTPRLEDILTTLVGAVFGFITRISGLVMQLVNAIIIPFLAFYMLMDFPVITNRFIMMVPRTRRGRTAELAGKVDDLMGKYFRGAIAVAIIQGCIAGLGLWAIGINYALVLGIMTGILDFVPYVGLVTSLIVSSIVAIFSGGNIFVKIIAVAVLYISQKLLEATVLGPKIIGKQVGIHPVLLILCLLAFGYFLGFIGLLIAVPATALIIAGVKEWELYRKARA